jgi:protein kinase A
MSANHPFILKLYSTFSDSNCIYFLLELVQGGELFSIIHGSGGCLNSDFARFYAACITSGLAHLHDKKICYRDLKPENVLIDKEGYCKIVDFGFAKIVKDVTFTLCGTPEYLSPELVIGKGHHKGVDYWALGILIYEMLCGYSPFQDPKNQDQVAICKNILRMKVEFPSYMVDSDAKDLILKLLTKDPNGTYYNIISYRIITATKRIQHLIIHAVHFFSFARSTSWLPQGRCE